MRSTVGFLVRLTITGILLYVVLRGVGLDAFGSSLSDARWEYFAAALALLPLLMLLKGLEWQYLLNNDGTLDKVPFRKATGSFLVGKTFSLFLPAGIGDLGRVTKLEGRNKLRVSGLVVLDKTFQITVTVACALPGVFWLFGLTAGLIASSLCIAVLLTLYSWPWLRRSSPKLNSVLDWKHLRELTGSVDLLHQRRITTVCLLLTLCIVAVCLLQGYLLVHAFEGGDFNLLGVLFLGFPLVVLANSLPFTLGGTGVREGAAYYVLPFLSVSEIAAVNAAFSLFLMDQVLTGLLGAPLLLHNAKTPNPESPSLPKGQGTSEYLTDTSPLV